ncbi:uncharacterized protein LOC125515237 [Triticum urartu]|uniref:Uncharacterized protein n=1 Tax=Triticum urartu TaxID=4572 RepID=A0A8R7QWT9_TRIUA|nr:uncharacterized protein LOC125515237 [Triticum urartu]
MHGASSSWPHCGNPRSWSGRRRRDAAAAVASSEAAAAPRRPYQPSASAMSSAHDPFYIVREEIQGLRAPHPSPGRPPQQGARPREQTAPLVPSRMCAAGRVLWRSKANRALSQLFRCGAPSLGNFKFEAACSPTQQRFVLFDCNKL